MQLTALAAGVTMVTLLTAGAAAQPGAQLPARDAAQRAAERIKTLQREADALATQESALLVQLRRFEVERQLRVEELGEIERERSGVEQSLAGDYHQRGGAAAYRGGRAARDRRAPGAGLQARAGRLRAACCWTSTICATAGRAYRTAAALTRIDRDRVAEHRRTLEAIGQQQARAGETAHQHCRAPGPCPRGTQPCGPGGQRTRCAGRGNRRTTRPECPADRRAAQRPATAAGVGRSARRRRTRRWCCH